MTIGELVTGARIPHALHPEPETLKPVCQNRPEISLSPSLSPSLPPSLAASPPPRSPALFSLKICVVHFTGCTSDSKSEFSSLKPRTFVLEMAQAKAKTWP